MAHIYIYIWVVVKIMVPCWIPIIVRHLIFRVPKKGTDSHPYIDHLIGPKVKLLHDEVLSASSI